MSSLRVNLPAALSAHGQTLSEFFNGMVFKLHVNVHKDEIVAKDVPKLIDLMIGELQEFKDQIAVDQNAENAGSELHDVGNFAYLLYWFLRRRGMLTSKDLFLNEFFEIDVENGQVFCKKTRSGSRLKVGEEYFPPSPGAPYRMQHAASGVVVTVTRRELVWWKAHGDTWPIGKVELIKDGYGVPAWEGIRNLKLVEPMPIKFPFVSQWKPKGKEDHPNYGKWVYQRRHNFVLIRVGYWDTDVEAAAEGIKLWKQKAREQGNV